MTQAEDAAYKAKIEPMRRQRDEEQERIWAESQAWCSDVWAKATEADDANPHL